MKKLNHIFSVLILIVLFSACRNDDEGQLEIEGQLEVEFVAKMGDEPLVILQDYSLQGGIADFEVVQFYITNLSIKESTGDTKIVIKEVDLVDFGSENTLFTKKLEKGTYKNIETGLGLDEFWGNSEPSSFEDDHPLSLFQNNFWIMSQSYIFVRIEGNFTKNGVRKSILYHLGDDSFFAKLESENTFEITEGKTTKKQIVFDMDAFFSDIDLDIQENTHTIGNFSVAEELNDKFIASFSVQ